MTLREEFEELADEEGASVRERSMMRRSAMWALRKAAEHDYCMFRTSDDIRKTITDDSLLQLAKELQ